MPTLLHKIRHHSELHPENVALTFNGQSYSYAALMEAVDRLRGSLAARGLKAGDSVAIILPNCPHFIISHLAVIGLGAVSVPINVLQKAREIESALEDAEARAVIGWANFAPESEKAAAHVESLRLRIYLGDSIPEGAENLVEMIASGDPLPESNEISDTDLAAIVYTSGANGHPRGVELSHANFSDHVREFGQMLRIRDTDRCLCAIPFSNICGLSEAICLPLSFGAEVQIHSRFHPGDTLQSLRDSGTTVFLANPSAYALMARFPSADKYDTSRIRYAISCEAKLADETARSVEDILHLNVFEGYGTTETCGIVALNLFPHLMPRGSVGQPISGHEICVLDKSGKPQPPDHVGQIAVRGSSVAKGYHKRKEKTENVFSDGWFLTSDYGFLDEQAHLFVSSHAEELILKGGFPVYSREIEEIVEGLPHVQEVAVIGVPDSILGEEIKAFVVLKEGAMIGPTEIIEYIKERIAVYKCPKIVKLMKELPRSTSGKIIRSQLRTEP